MLNEVKHLPVHRERSFAEFTLERSEGLRMTNITDLVRENIIAPWQHQCAALNRQGHRGGRSRAIHRAWGGGITAFIS